MLAFSALVVSVVVLALGQWMPVNFAPRSIITVLFAATVADTIVPAVRQDPANVDRTLALVILIVVSGGVFQALFGVLRLGDVIRYIPSPVMSGFQNAVALLLLVAQVNALLGLTRRVPAPIAGLVAGSALHYALALLGLGTHLGPTLGRIPAVTPSFTPFATLPSLIGDAYLRAHWPSF